MNQGPPTWHDVFEVSSYWADLSGHLYLHGALQMMQDSAWKHAESLGFGYTHLGAASLLWVLSRLDLHITRMPEWGETVRLETWPTGTHRIFAMREYCLYDDDERELLRANSAWLVLDGESRTPRKPQAVMEGNNIVLNPGNYDETPGKVREPQGSEANRAPPAADGAKGAQPAAGGDSIGETTEDIGPTNAHPAPGSESATRHYTQNVRYSDIDTQNHVNNARYVEWMLNALPDHWIGERRPREMSINFLRECVIGDEIDVVCEHSDIPAESRHAVYHCPSDEPSEPPATGTNRRKQAAALMSVRWQARKS